MNESERAVMESARFAAMESYFEARPQIAITRKLECVFEAGFDAAYAEVRRLREQRQNDDIQIELLEHRLESFKEDNARLREENPPQSLSAWQPIATAPKDGTDILVMTGETMHVVRWENVHGDFDYWVVDDNKHGPFTLRGKEPTHWMPLPEPAP